MLLLSTSTIHFRSNQFTNFTWEIFFHDLIPPFGWNFQSDSRYELKFTFVSFATLQFLTHLPVAQTSISAKNNSVLSLLQNLNLCKFLIHHNIQFPKSVLCSYTKMIILMVNTHSISNTSMWFLYKFVPRLFKDLLITLDQHSNIPHLVSVKVKSRHHIWQGSQNQALMLTELYTLFLTFQIDRHDLINH